VNERIKKIAEETDAWCKEYYFGQDPNNIDWEKKFAELIALECARVVKASSPNGMIGVTAIRIHFGLEP
jgi:hypothetical protein